MGYAIHATRVHHPELFKNKRPPSEEEKARLFWSQMSHKYGPASKEAIGARKEYEQLRGRPIGVL